MKAKEKFDVYQAVTDQVIAALEAGTVPWRKPWAGGGDGVQINARTRKPYRGINQLLLGMTGHTSPYWMTAKQAFSVGASIKAGQARKDGGPGPALVVFWKNYDGKAKAGEKGAKIDPKTGAFVTERFVLRFYNVWNSDQLEDLPDGMIPEPLDVGECPPRVDEAESVLHAYIDEQSIGYVEAGSRAFYAPSSDRIGMPPLERFESAGSFYGAAFHEATHSTGHASRLKRPGVVDEIKFGSEPYGKEELVAEMGAAMLCALLRLDGPELDENRDAYIGSWLATIKGDSKLVVMAAAQAQKAADMIVGDRWADLVDITPWEDEAEAESVAVEAEVGVAA